MGILPMASRTSRRRRLVRLWRTCRAPVDRVPSEPDAQYRNCPEGHDRVAQGTAVGKDIIPKLPPCSAWGNQRGVTLFHVPQGVLTLRMGTKGVSVPWASCPWHPGPRVDADLSAYGGLVVRP